MQVTSLIPCGNGRILRATPELIEVELIAYSKGSRYTYFRISDITEKREQQIALLPDHHFRIPGFPWKQHVDVWVRYGETGEWNRIKKTEKTPEKVLLWIDVQPGENCYISTEPPREYSRTTQELFTIVQNYPEWITIYCLGHSIEHRPLFLLRITDPQNRCRPGEEFNPVIHIVCGEHATEFAGEEIGRGMLNLVLAEQNADLRKDFVFDFVLNCNPDGNYHGWHQYNAKDWLAHNYSDTVDRSWHHEFVPYMKNEPLDYSPETVALMDWMLLTRPALYLNMHSWESREGNPGAYYCATELLKPDMAVAMQAVNEIAITTAAEFGLHFHASSYTQVLSPHLGEYLVSNDICLAYAPEGNYHAGKETLQTWGEQFLNRCLNHHSIKLRQYDKNRWQQLRAPLKSRDI